MLARILALGALLAAVPAHAADEFRSECRIGMSEAEFTRANTELFGQGFRLVDLTVTEVKGKPVMGAIWQRFSGMPAPSAERTKAQLARVFLKLDQEGLRKAGQTMGAEGSQVEVIDAYRAGGKTWFAASFSPANEPVMQNIGAFLTPEMFTGMREEARKADNDLVRVDAYNEGDKVMTLPVFVGRGKAEVEVKIFDNTMAIGTEGVGMYLNDMHPLSISVFDDAQGDAHWVASWDKSQPRDFIMTDDGSKIRERIASGGIIFDIDSHNAYDGSVSYYAVAQGGKK